MARADGEGGFLLLTDFWEFKMCVSAWFTFTCERDKANPSRFQTFSEKKKKKKQKRNTFIYDIKVWRVREELHELKMQPQ